MNKIFILFYFLIILLPLSFAEHPLYTPGEYVKIESEEAIPDFLFFPVKQLSNEATSGVCLVDIGVDVVGFVYVSVKKSENISEAYIIRSKDSSERMIQLIIEVKKEYENRVRVRQTGLNGRFYANYKHDKMNAEIESATSKFLEKEKSHPLFEMAEDIKAVYEKEGKRGVQKKYGKTKYEINVEKTEAEERAEKLIKQREQQKNKKPAIDKKGCIAYVNDDNLIKVVAKKASYNGTRFAWSVKIKNPSDSYIDSCFVHLKCLDKDGLQIVEGIESVSNIAPGEERIISGTTLSCSYGEAKKVKIKQFEITAYE